MQLPFFYIPAINNTQALVSLSEDNAKHIVQVLRMQTGEKIKLTDGVGNIYEAVIIEAHKKNCTVKISSEEKFEKPEHSISIAISPLKNNSRLEWFLEKATEIGITEIIPIICSRTEKQFVKQERLQSIVISAMLQSQQAWLPILKQPIKLNSVIPTKSFQNKLIAHCQKSNLPSLQKIHLNSHNTSTLLLIGPEGDFTVSEIETALANGFTEVSLGNTRLRTETAALVGAVLLRNS
jgi:16S rRNA (uracil1498-N3)-methyltransferase